MIYEFNIRGKIFTVNTKNINYDAVWSNLHLKKKQREGANKIIDLYNSNDFNEEITIITARSWMKPYNRETQRHQADKYRTSSELYKVAKNNKIVRKLINKNILNIHPKWIGLGIKYKNHPQTPYKLNVWEIHRLENLEFE